MKSTTTNATAIILKNQQAILDKIEEGIRIATRYEERKPALNQFYYRINPVTGR